MAGEVLAILCSQRIVLGEQVAFDLDDAGGSGFFRSLFRLGCGIVFCARTERQRCAARTRLGRFPPINTSRLPQPQVEHITTPI